ncbi:biogenesis of lysosome-related organelles complex 1 subunit 5-like [Gigaspora margarita]|uniref:Biogenesis of lysosome-related organelles complex 1 subunit 5 n=1 Tax=Gigaspora margarita TaxID=4874 RepID=A0A8H3WYV4_GIGMA|nr:biogenesis of lysosome-related organelles complex 1 subunit 5-like [Gigaspora margarita]
MFKQDIKTITQDAGTFYGTIFNHPKDNVNKEIKSFVREFESNRNNREYGNLEKCIVLAQGAPDKFSSGTFLFDKNMNDVKEKLNNAKPTFTSLLEDLETLKQSRRLRQDLYQQDRKQFMDNQNQAKQEFDNEFKEREQKLIKEYRTMMEEALRGVYDPSASVTSNITSGSSSKHND